MSRTATSLRGARMSVANERHSLMWYETTTSTAASAARGMNRVVRPRKTSTSSTVIEWTIPATGVRPPFFTFVAVRAMAPVTGMPPNSPDPMLPMPWATSSMFDLCRVPIIPSATTAESSDSIAASKAIVTAEGNSSRILSAEKTGNFGAGIDA